MKRSVLLIISIVLFVLSCGLFGYLYYQNTTTEKEAKDYGENIKKVQKKIDNEKKEIDEKENEYDKLKETVKEKLEELNIWEEIKEKVEKSLS